MRQLNYELNQLSKKNRDGSFSTQSARSRILAQCANELHDLGFRRLSAKGLKSKHIDALVKQWLQRELAPGTIKNRMAHIRWWADKIGKGGVVRSDNDAYGIMHRVYVTNVDKSRQLDARLNAVRDEYVRVSLRLQEAFGLRREESIKFSPSYADKGDKITLKESWTKGGKSRDIAVRNEAQRTALRAAHKLAGRGSLIPTNKNYIRQLKIYEKHVSEAGFNKLHGLRHAYAQRRYEQLTGWACPVREGPSRRNLTDYQREEDIEARLLISKELGHERLEVVAVYLGN